MFSSLYQEYLYVVGKIKDIHGLDCEVNHRDVHTFYDGKRPLFKLVFGTFNKEDSDSIVILFHIEMRHPEVIIWFSKIYNIHPMLRLNDSWIEDDKGDYFIGENAEKIFEIYRAQEVLATWLETHTKEEIEDFVQSKVEGADPTPKTFESKQLEAATKEFERLRKASDDDEVH